MKMRFENRELKQNGISKISFAQGSRASRLQAVVLNRK
jgi:hypothetical protein